MRHSDNIRLALAALVLAACGGSAGCDGAAPAGASSGSPGAKLPVVATTGMIADAAARVGGDRVEVTGLMGPGVDPHLYKASEGDLRRLQGAALILYNGLNLEGKMGDILVQMARKRPTVAVTDAIDPSLLREPPEFQGHYDPHVWFDVSLWRRVVDRIAAAIAEVAPDGRAAFEANAKAYGAELDALHEWCRTEIARVPKDRRVLITAHDAFGYFGRAYDIEVIGLQGISTVSDFSLADVTRLVDTIVARKIKAVFVESSVPKRAIEAVVEGCRARGHEVRIGGTLFSDAMGAPGTPEGTYVGMVRHNVRTIVEALR